MKGQRGNGEDGNATERTKRCVKGVDVIMVLFHLYHKLALAVIEQGGK